MFRRLIEALEQIAYESSVANVLRVIEIHSKDGLEIDKAEDNFMESEVDWIYGLEAKHDPSSLPPLTAEQESLEAES